MCQERGGILWLYLGSLLIKVGCRPFRHVRIRDCTRPMQTENSTEVENTSYQDIVQCEFTSIVGKDIALVLDLYDSDEKVMEVTHDYILWEENNKHGYSYTATMAQNYESCFDSSGVSVPFDGNQPYQIINSTGMSRVTFTDEGRFNFTFKVVDPSLSFCTLTGRFTVMVRPGVDSKEFLPEIISMCVVILASLGFLCASFWFYRRETLGEHEQDRQTTERLQQLRYATVPLLVL
ncbi:hypothetical protein QZH41_012589 [Actinostola sp. cb2023]|nr:hypothetical protein QZH41_012589 [Actinostola sp. cb2023]